MKRYMGFSEFLLLIVFTGLGCSGGLSSSEPADNIRDLKAEQLSHIDTNLGAPAPDFVPKFNTLYSQITGVVQFGDFTQPDLTAEFESIVSYQDLKVPQDTLLTQLRGKATLYCYMDGVPEQIELLVSPNGIIDESSKKIVLGARFRETRLCFIDPTRVSGVTQLYFNDIEVESARGIDSISFSLRNQYQY